MFRHAQFQSTQLKLSIALFSTCACVCCVIVGLSRWSFFVDLCESVIYQSEKARGDIYSYRGPHQDFEDRLLLQDIRLAEYTRGGACFFGSSNMKWAFMNWAVPPENQDLVRNYGIGSVNHYEINQFIEFLIENEGLLERVENKPTLIFGLTYDVATESGDYHDRFFGSIWGRRGYYKYSAVEGISPNEMPDLQRRLEIEKAYASGCMLMVARVARAAFRMVMRDHAVEVGREIASSRHDSERYQNILRGMMGDKWRENMVKQVAIFEKTICSLQEQKVPVKVVLLPRGSWDKGLPFHREYQRQISSLCLEHAISLIDLSGFLQDDSFADASHPNGFGQEKLFPELCKVAGGFAVAESREPDGKSQVSLGK